MNRFRDPRWHLTLLSFLYHFMLSSSPCCFWQASCAPLDLNFALTSISYQGFWKLSQDVRIDVISFLPYILCGELRGYGWFPFHQVLFGTLWYFSMIFARTFIIPRMC